LGLNTDLSNPEKVKPGKDPGYPKPDLVSLAPKKTTPTVDEFTSNEPPEDLFLLL
jgi:hypothetical protein